MKLKKFINKFVCPNTLIRLQYEVQGGHEEVIIGDPKMEWQLINSEFANKKVIGVTDILYLNNHYSEAVNIVIKRE